MSKITKSYSIYWVDLPIENGTDFLPFNIKYDKQHDLVNVTVEKEGKFINPDDYLKCLDMLKEVIIDIKKGEM